VTLFALVGVMGWRIGRSDEVVRSFATVGLTALVFGAFAVAGTVGVLLLAGHVRGRQSGVTPPRGARGAGPGRSWAALLRDPALLLAALAAGFALARLVMPAADTDGATLIAWILYVLLFLIGLGLAASGLTAREILAHPDLVLVPVGAAIGTFLGGALAGLLMHVRLGASLSLAAGFGWYSLSGVILTRLGGPSLGAVSFLANMVREVLALVLIPLLGRAGFPQAAVGSGGATAMDVTLPLIEKSCGPRFVPVAMVSGGLLSLSVPILVPLFFGIGG
jgi:uncharacterized membrane protein YbjE (DUF340 family)